jgi:hypothetical protein
MQSKDCTSGGTAMSPVSQKKAKFFALARELGYEAEVVKERAKQRFALASFNDITPEQLSWLIERLTDQQMKRRSGTKGDDHGERP